jgi:predicted tellurium resistance membrane protein TerC
MSPRRFCLVAVLALLAGWGVSDSVRGISESVPTDELSPSDALQAKVDIPGANGTESVTATLGFRSLVLTTHYGPITLDVSKANLITVMSVEGDIARTTVELLDGHRLRGAIPTTALPVTIDGQARPLTPAGGLRFKLVRPGDFGLWAALIGLLTLTLMEIVLGIDNVIFLAIVAGKLPVEQQPRARRVGLGAALVTRLILLFSITWLLGLTQPVFTLPDMPLFHDPDARGVSWRDLILLVGGAFLIGKSVVEIHDKAEGGHGTGEKPKKAASFAMVILQIAIIDIVFSLDSVITAVGMVEELWVMVVAVIVAVGIMIAFAEPISRFVERNPTIKVLALSFLILIGVLLVADGLGQHMNKGYIYFAMAFAVGVELVNMRLRKA